MLELEIDGKSVTEDEYLENALKLIPGRGRAGVGDWEGLGSAELLPSSVGFFCICSGMEVCRNADCHWLVMPENWSLISFEKSRTWNTTKLFQIMFFTVCTLASRV